jgi:hypothetical protein
MYLAHNLWVVSPDIACLRDAPFKDCIRFYERGGEDTEPMRIASCIRELPANSALAGTQPREQLIKLRDEFEAKLTGFFNADPC